MMRRLLVAALLLPIAGGCATKRDLQDLQTEIGEMRAAQERLLREIQQQNETILDSMSVQGVRLRGDFANQLIQLERQLVQIQELTGQGQQRIAQLQEDLRRREEAQRQAQQSLTAADVGDADELFESAEGALERGSLATAKTAFSEFVSAYPQHPRTPAARLFLGNILRQENAKDEALAEYTRIWELHPNVPEAAAALYAASQIERENGNTERARTMLNQLTAAYPTSPEAGVARVELRQLR
jgi:tol-pal system protein YbgF